jgi:hypothetical protein
MTMSLWKYKPELGPPSGATVRLTRTESFSIRSFGWSESSYLNISTSLFIIRLFPFSHSDAKFGKIEVIV